MFALWKQILKSPRATRGTPQAPPPWIRGMPVSDPAKCDGCGGCVDVCPSRCITVRQTAEIDWGACAVAVACWGDAPESLGGVDKIVQVDVHIPGCPPRPDAMIFGLLVAMGRMEAKRDGQDGRALIMRSWLNRGGLRL